MVPSELKLLVIRYIEFRSDFSGPDFGCGPVVVKLFHTRIRTGMVVHVELIEEHFWPVI